MVWVKSVRALLVQAPSVWNRLKFGAMLPSISCCKKLGRKPSTLMWTTCSAAWAVVAKAIAIDAKQAISPCSRTMVFIPLK